MADPDDIGRGVPKSFWQTTWFWVVAWFVLCAVAGALLCLDIPGFVTGETDILGNYTFETERDEKRSQMTPMERVHAETFPRWLIAEANRWDTAPQKYEKLRKSLDDEELLAIVEEMKSAIDSGAMVRPPGAELAEPSPDGGYVAPEPPDPVHAKLLRRWNDRLGELGRPFYVTGSISSTSAGPALLCEFYRRLAAPSVIVGEREHPTVILQRIDRTNIVEAYLGVAHQGGIAVVVTDRILDLATDEVWLMLNPATSPEGPLTQTWAPAIREEARAALGEETIGRLAESAKHRRALLDTVESVLSRRSCGSRMQFGYISWDGLDPRELDRMDAYAERDKIQPCPTMKFEEADALREASEALQSEENKRALERLVAWLTRMIALHEARHVADELERDSMEAPESCPGCPEGLRRATRAELSAYVASIAWSDSPATALYQACTIRYGPHRRAVWLLNRELGRKCDEAPPDDLPERARGAERAFFGIATPMELPPEFPDRLEIHRFR